MARLTAQQSMEDMLEAADVSSTTAVTVNMHRYMCHQCSYGTDVKGDMAKHERKHSGEK